MRGATVVAIVLAALCRLVLAEEDEEKRPDYAALMKAAQDAGDDKRYLQLLDEKVAPIHKAVKAGDLERVRKLLAKNPALANLHDSQNGPPYDGAPLHTAAVHGRAEIAKALIEAGARVNEPESEGDTGGTTPAHWAAAKGHLDVLKVLEAAGADLLAKDDYGCTPFFKAAASGHVDVMRWLLERKADPLAVTRLGTALHEASGHGGVEAVKLLLELKADVNARGSGGIPQRPDGWTPLHFAAYGGDPESAKLLLARGADPRAVSEEGATPLHYAAEGWVLKKRHAAVVDVLLHAGAVIDARNEVGFTPAQLAAQENSRECVEYLAARGAKLDFACAAKVCWTEKMEPLIVKDPLLINRPLPDFEAAGWLWNRRGARHPVSRILWTPLFHAVFRKDEAALAWLLERQADVNCRDHRGASPLHHAAWRGNLGIVERLLKSKASLVATDDEESTPLHYAAQGGDVATIKLLLEAGADPTRLNRWKLTPLGVALKYKHTEAAEFLKRQGTGEAKEKR